MARANATKSCRFRAPQSPSARMAFSSKSITSRTKRSPTACSLFCPRNSSPSPMTCVKSPLSSTAPLTSRLAISIFVKDDSCLRAFRPFRSSFRLILPDSKLLLSSQPYLEIFAARCAKSLQNDSRHSFRVGPRHLAPSCNACSRGKIKCKIDHRGMLQSFRRAQCHAAFAHVGHSRMLFQFPIVQNYREIYGMPEVAPPLAFEQLLRNRDMESDTVLGQRFS